jgi:hypothetical protein
MWKYVEIVYGKETWDERMENLQAGLGFLFFPLLAGLLVRWVLLGFRGKKAD